MSVLLNLYQPLGLEALEGYTLQIILIIILLGLSALFSGTETALMSFGPAAIHKQIEQKSIGTSLLVQWRDNPNQVIAGILVLNNLVNILASSVATSLSAQILEEFGITAVATWSVAIAVGVMTFLLITFGEVLPKTYAKHNKERFLFLFPLVYMLCFFTRPAAIILQKVAGGMITAVGGEVRSETEVTEDEIETMIRIGSEKGALRGETQKLLTSVIDFSETMAKEVMVPRIDVVGFRLDSTVQDVLKVVAEKKFSRYPVYEDDLDSIIGIITVKDLLDFLAKGEPTKFSLSEMVKQRKTLFVPESKKIGELLKEFQQEHLQMAIVVDEFGGTAGIVTMEDVIEEIVGEIYDEHEKTQEPIREIGDGRYLVSARVPWEDLASFFNLSLEEQDLYESVGGLVLAQAGRVPERGEVISFAGLLFEVRERTRTRLITLCVSREKKGDEQT